MDQINNQMAAIQTKVKLAMLDDKPEDKQLTQDEINDLKRLEKIKNGK